MADAIAAFGAARDALNANIFGGQVGDDSSAFQRSLETFINSVAAAAEAAAQLPAPASPRVQPQPPPRDEDLLWANPRRRAESDDESLEDVNPDADGTDSIDLDAEPPRRAVGGAEAEYLDEVSSEASDDAAAPNALAAAQGDRACWAGEFQSARRGETEPRCSRLRLSFF